MTSAILAISVDAPHGQAGTQTHRFEDVGSYDACERISKQLTAAKARGQARFALYDRHGYEIASFPLERVTGVRVYRAEIDVPLVSPTPTVSDFKSLAAGD